MSKQKKPRVVNMRVRFSPADYELVKAAARKRLISFNTFVSGLSTAIAKRVLEAPDESTADKLAAEVWADLAGKPDSASSRH